MNKIKNLLSFKNLDYLWILFVSFLFIFFFSGNSILFRFNNNLESIKYIQMGVTWITHLHYPVTTNSEVISPLHIFVIGIFGLIKIGANNLGLFILQWMSYFFTLVYFYKTVNVLLKSNQSSLLLTTLVSVIYFATVSFNIPNTYLPKNVTLFINGLSVEEFCLPFISILTYYCIVMFNEENFNVSKADLVIIAVSISILLLEKFILIIPMMVIAIIVVSYLYKSNLLSYSISNIIVVISIVVAMILVFALFIGLTSSNYLLVLHYIKSSLKEILSTSIPFKDRIFLSIFNGIWMIKTNVLLVITFFTSIFGIIFSKRFNNSFKIGILAILLIVFEVNLMNNKIQPQLLLPVLPIMLIGLVVILPEKIGYLLNTQLKLKLVVVLLITLLYAVSSNWNDLSKVSLIRGQQKNDIELLADSVKSSEDKVEKTFLLWNNDVEFKTLIGDNVYQNNDFVKYTATNKGNLEQFTNLSIRKPKYIYVKSTSIDKALKSNVKKKKLSDGFKKILKKYSIWKSSSSSIILKRK